MSPEWQPAPCRRCGSGALLEAYDVVGAAHRDLGPTLRDDGLVVAADDLQYGEPRQPDAVVGAAHQHLRRRGRGERRVAALDGDGADLSGLHDVVAALDQQAVDRVGPDRVVA